MTSPSSAQIIAPGLISHELVNEYGLAWNKAVEAGSATPLEPLFTDAAGTRMRAVAFPLEQIVSLVSTVGGRYVKARFVLAPGADGQPRFSLVLFATDETQRLSAFYWIDPAKPAAAPVAKPAVAQLDAPVPDVLSSNWVGNWREAKELETSMFAASTGEALQGYSFNVQELIKPLFAAQPGTGQHLHFELALHQYYGVNSDVEPARTFGLVVRLHDQQGDAVASEPVFDMAAPCPPGHIAYL